MSRRAPPVHLEAGDDRTWRLLRRTCALVVLLGTLCWCVSAALSAGAWLQPLAVFCLAVTAALAAWPRQAKGRAGRHLGWDGAQWSLGHAPCRLHVRLDFGAWLLLAVEPIAAPGQRQWLALSRHDHMQRWHALRCALYCAGPHSAPPDSGTGDTPPP